MCKSCFNNMGAIQKMKLDSNGLHQTKNLNIVSEKGLVTQMTVWRRSNGRDVDIHDIQMKVWMCPRKKASMAKLLTDPTEC